MEMGEYDESIANYRKALEFDAHFPSAYAGIAINESLKGNTDAALAATEEMLAAARNDAQKRGAMFQKVTTHLYAGNVDEAMAAAKDFYALARDQENLSAMGGISEYMGDIMAVSGDGASALEHYETALENDANKAQAERTYMFKAAIAAMVDGDNETFASRAAEYTAAAEANGTAFEQRRVHELAGYLASVNDDHETSVAELAQANQLDPIVLYWQAVANKNAGDEDKAAALASQAAWQARQPIAIPCRRTCRCSAARR
jgi:tetratricopeptide (TPR) repeat protein